MIEIKRKEECVGCSACYDICPKDAITMKVDSEGFRYPHVNLDRCINCHLCEKTCPVINSGKLNQTNVDSPVVLAAYNTDADVRFVSTTGGIYSALAGKVLSEGGFIGGAVWTEDFGARHILSNRPEDLVRLRGSKYFQSDAEGFYKSVAEAVKTGNTVLVCGTPCQMAGLRAFLRRPYDNLIIVDFICCSINSPKVFKGYVRELERRHGAKMTSYHPKNKEYGGWHSFAFKATFANGRVYAKRGIEDDFTYCFIGSHIAARPCCHECRFKQIPRVADITIADFWGIENVDPEWDSPNGTSLVLLNNDKGRCFFESLDGAVAYKAQRLEDAAVANGNLYNSIRPSAVDREKFYSALERRGFGYAMRKFGRPEPRFLALRKAARKVINILSVR